MVYDYLYLRAWAEVMEYSHEELEEALAHARRDNAPQDALFPMKLSDNWHTTNILAADLLANLDARVAKLKATTKILR